MNIFILSTGRCGSTTFIEACKHIKNYSSSHESRCSMIGDERLNYPISHIEADNRLSWLLGRIDEKYGNDAFYVHLKRNKHDTARSFTKRYSYGIIKAYRGDGVLMGTSDTIDSMSISLDYCNTVNSNIELFLKDKSKKMTISLEKIDQDFIEFWEQVKAEGDIKMALEEFNIKYNATKLDKKNYPRSIIHRSIHKLKRVFQKFPEFIKNS
jgi:hypothetical protein